MKQDFQIQWDDSNNSILHSEPSEIILKSMTSLAWKIRFVILMLPKHRQQSLKYLRKWDLWGPFIICLFFAIPMSIVNDNPQYEQDFVNVFLIFWIGSILVSINCKLLGSKGSLLLIVSIVGYCVMPLAIIGFVTSLLHSIIPIVLKLILQIMGLFWSCISCMLVMTDLVSGERKWLCTYPIFLFYVFLSWYSIVA